MMERYFEIIFLFLFAALIIFKTVINYRNGRIDYDENYSGHWKKKYNAGFGELDLAELERIKGGVEETGYVQNNNAKIEKYLATVNPTFNSRDFIAWAKSLLMDISKSCGADNSFVDKNFQLSFKIYNIYTAYLHRYVKKGDYDIMEMYVVMTSDENTSESEAGRYFAIFKRKSCFVMATNGEMRGVSCPCCGAEISFCGKTSTVCPYCGNTVSFRENDWRLCEIVPVGNDVENIGIVRED